MARVHGHCGCARRTSVGPLGSGARRLCAGHRPGAAALAPGLFSYAITSETPVTTQTSQKAAITPSQIRRCGRAASSSCCAEMCSGRKDSTRSNPCASGAAIGQAVGILGVTSRARLKRDHLLGYRQCHSGTRRADFEATNRRKCHRTHVVQSPAAGRHSWAQNGTAYVVLHGPPKGGHVAVRLKADMSRSA